MGEEEAVSKLEPPHLPRHDAGERVAQLTFPGVGRLGQSSHKQVNVFHRTVDRQHCAKHDHDDKFGDGEKGGWRGGGVDEDDHDNDGDGDEGFV